MRQTSLTSPISLYIFGAVYFCGMPKKGLAPYRADDSGPSAKPFPQSTVAEEDRIDYLLHKSFNKAWTGPNLGPACRRYMQTLSAEIDKLPLTREWTDLDDFFKYFGKVVSYSLIKTIFGPSLLQRNPDFIDAIWAFDDSLPWLIRMVPSFLMPGAHRNRAKIHSQLRNWYAYSRQWFSESSINPDGDGDPFWGSGIVRRLQQELLRRGNHGFLDDDCFAAHDLGLIWG